MSTEGLDSGGDEVAAEKKTCTMLHIEVVLGRIQSSTCRLAL